MLTEKLEGLYNFPFLGVNSLDLYLIICSSLFTILAAIGWLQDVSLNPNFLNLSFLIPLSALVFLIFKIIRRKKNFFSLNTSNILYFKRNSLFILFFITLSSMLIRLFLLDKRPLWFDEYHTFLILNSYGEIFEKSLLDLQLPFYYYIQSTFLYIFHKNESTLRLSSLIAAGLIFFFPIYINRKNYFSAIITLLFIAITPFFIGLSLNARPYSLALLWLLFFIYYLLKEILTHTEQITCRSYSQLLLSFLLLLLTLNFISIFLFLALIPSILIASKLSHEEINFSPIKKISYIFIFALPLNFLLIYKHRSVIMDKFKLFDMDFLYNQIINLNLLNTKIIKINSKIFYSFCLITIVLSFVRHFKNRLKLSFNSYLLITWIIIYSSIFSLAYCLFFEVDFIPPRFSFIIMGMLFFIISTLSNRLSKSNLLRFSNFNLNLISNLALCITLTYFLFNFYRNYTQPKLNYNKYTQWKRIYNEAEKLPPSLIRILSTNSSFNPGFVGKKLYVTKSANRYLQKSSSIYEDIHLLRSLDYNQILYIIPIYWNPNFTLDKDLTNISNVSITYRADLNVYFIKLVNNEKIDQSFNYLLEKLGISTNIKDFSS